LVENDDEEGDPSMENITFLYTLVDGPAPKSYGFFTARMAGIPVEVIRRAYKASKEMDTGEHCVQKLHDLSLAVKEDRISDDQLLIAISSS
jgi:DNA mismatch repair protein MSH6